MKVKSESEVTQSCLTRSDPMNCLPGSSVHGIFQARVLEWAAIAFSGTNLRRAETIRKKQFKFKAWEKEISNTISFLKLIVKRQRKTTQMKEQIRNTEVQINEEEIGKLSEKNSE